MTPSISLSNWIQLFKRPGPLLLAELTQAQAVKISDAIWMLISIHSFVLILVATLLHSRRS